MALPKLNASPKYSLIVPSTKQEIRYRPYLVKEEKVLMLAMESQDQKQAMRAVVDTIAACVDGEFDPKSLTTFDVEYMFVQIRAKSVGESAKINVKCTKCGHDHPLSIDLGDIKVDFPPVEHIIELTPEISLKMNFPKYAMISSLDMGEGVSQTKQAFEMIAMCIDSVQTPDENVVLKDEPKAEIMNFLESLTSAQFKKVQTFVEAMPKVTHTVNFNCNSCGEHSEIKLEGMNDFL